MYRISKLYQQPIPLSHTQDLALILGITNRNTLYTTTNRWVKKGVLYKIYKGFYSLYPLEKINPYLLGLVSLRDFGYLSCETVLFEKGVIFQPPAFISLVSNRSLRFKIGPHLYRVRQLKPEFLYHPAGIIKKGGVFKASLYRAVADMLYFAPFFHFDNPDRINWKEVERIQKMIGYQP